MSRKRQTSAAGAAYLEAARDRVLVAGEPDPVVAGWHQRDAERHQLAATAPLSKESALALGVPADVAYQDGQPVVRLLDTARNPAPVAAEAHLERLRLAEDAGCLEAAADMSATLRATNSMERALAHQLAAAHTMAMRLTADAGRWLGKADPDVVGQARATAANVEAARLMNAAAKMMSTFQEGVATLAKLRSGGRQLVTVQHVHVGEGGQAVVAGRLASDAPLTRGSRKSRGRR